MLCPYCKFEMRAYQRQVEHPARSKQMWHAACLDKYLATHPAKRPPALMRDGEWVSPGRAWNHKMPLFPVDWEYRNAPRAERHGRRW